MLQLLDAHQQLGYSKQQHVHKCCVPCGTFFTEWKKRTSSPSILTTTDVSHASEY